MHLVKVCKYYTWWNDSEKSSCAAKALGNIQLQLCSFWFIGLRTSLSYLHSAVQRSQKEQTLFTWFYQGKQLNP